MVRGDGGEGEDGEGAGEEGTERVVGFERADGAVGVAGEGVR